MGRIGFIFEINNSSNKLIFFNNKPLNKDFLTVFIEKKEISGDYIIGLKQFSKLNDSQLVFLNKKLEFEDYFIFENPKFKYSKISLSEKTIVDFENLTFWFEVKKYKLLWELLILDKSYDFEDKLKRNLFKILDCFK